jgi:hypothetical protein
MPCLRGRHPRRNGRQPALTGAYPETVKTRRDPGAFGHGPHICTIIACNYLPAARVLARSFKKANPSGTISVLLLDDVHRSVDASSEPFEILRPEELGEDTAEIHRMAAIYDVTEFATALKPWLLEHLLDSGLLSVIYLDPDIFVYDDLTELVTLADRGGIVITPHALAPFPRDQKMKTRQQCSQTVSTTSASSASGKDLEGSSTSGRSACAESAEWTRSTCASSTSGGSTSCLRCSRARS